MTSKRFVTLLCSCSFIFIFATIYQHNYLVHLVYEKQHLELTRKNLMNEYDEKLTTLYAARSPKNILRKAKELGLKPLKLTQLQSATHDS